MGKRTTEDPLDHELEPSCNLFGPEQGEELLGRLIARLYLKDLAEKERHAKEIQQKEGKKE